MKTGLYCSAGYDYFAIASNGDVAPCLAFVIPPEYRLGNLFEGAVRIRSSEEWFYCPTQACHSPCDRSWSRKQVWENGTVVDNQEVRDSTYLTGKRPVTLLWTPTWKCNYKCSYCNLPPANGEREAADWIGAFTRFFDDNGIDGGQVLVTGGEPLFYKDIGSVFRFLVERGFTLHLTTNLTGDINSSLVRAVPPEKFSSINCSLHPSEKQFRWEHFRGRVLALKAYGYNVAVNFVGHPDQVMLAPEYHSFFASHDIPFILIPMEGEFNGFQFLGVDDYPPAMRAVFEDVAKGSVQDRSRFVNGRRHGLPLVSVGGPQGQPSVWQRVRKFLTPTATTGQ